MNKIFVVFRNELTLFFCRQGNVNILFSCYFINGRRSTFFFIKDMATCISFAGFLTITFLIPLLADSLAGEREKKEL